MKRKVLIIDDDKIITSYLDKHLTEEGYLVESINDPAEAMSKIETNEYLIVILDIIMPNINGLELLKTIKAYNASIQVIIITGQASINNLLRCMRYGATDCILKPFEVSDVKESIDYALKHIEKWEGLVTKLIRKKRSSKNVAA